MLKRHLITAPAYSACRSELAKSLRLGRHSGGQYLSTGTFCRLSGWRTSHAEGRLTEEERHLLASVTNEFVRTRRYPLTSWLAPIKSALATLDPAGEPPQELGQRKKARR